jgi:hypothetical protein
LVLCFDGIGDLFDKDVSQLPSPSYVGSRLKLIVALTEFQYRAIPGNVEE